MEDIKKSKNLVFKHNLSIYEDYWFQFLTYRKTQHIYILDKLCEYSLFNTVFTVLNVKDTERLLNRLLVRQHFLQTAPTIQCFPVHWWSKSCPVELAHPSTRGVPQHDWQPNPKLSIGEGGEGERAVKHLIHSLCVLIATPHQHVCRRHLWMRRRCDVSVRSTN